MKALVSVSTLLACLNLFGQGAAASQSARETSVASIFARVVIAQTSISAEQAAALVQARTGGRILAVDRIRQQGREYYRVKVLTPKGEVQILLVDAATGAL